MAALMMMAAMTMTSCASSKKINGDSNASKSSEMGKNEEDLDNSYLVLSDAQQDIVKKNNAFALRLFNKVTDMESKVISPMSVSYLMGMLANGADGITQQEILKAIGCEGVSVNDLNELYKAMLLNVNDIWIPLSLFLYQRPSSMCINTASELGSCIYVIVPPLAVGMRYL